MLIRLKCYCNNELQCIAYGHSAAELNQKWNSKFEEKPIGVFRLWRVSYRECWFVIQLSSYTIL